MTIEFYPSTSGNLSTRPMNVDIGLKIRKSFKSIDLSIWSLVPKAGPAEKRSSADGISSNEDMESQLKLAIKNLEQVITEAGYECSGIVRLNIYTTATHELWPHFSIIQDWVAKHNIKQATTLMEVKSLFETLKVELEATVVK